MAVDDIERGMAQEEQGCSNSSSSCGGGGRYKKAKQKRPPQRGLGVAQLEKLRLEEQQKMAATAGFISPLAQQQPFIFFPLPSAHLPPPDSLFDSLDLYSSAPPAPPAYNFNSQHRPAMWNSLELNNHDAAEKHKFQTMLSFRPPSYTDFSSIWHSSGVIPRNQSQQQQQPSSMVNVPSSPSSSSGVNLQMEPPSNQSYCSNSTTSWSEGERGSIEYKVLHSGVLGQQQQPFYRFLPTGPNGHPPASGDRIAEGADAIVDLNLKL